MRTNEHYGSLEKGGENLPQLKNKLLIYSIKWQVSDCSLSSFPSLHAFFRHVDHTPQLATCGAGSSSLIGHEWLCSCEQCLLTVHHLVPSSQVCRTFKHLGVLRLFHANMSIKAKGRLTWSIFGVKNQNRVLDFFCGKYQWCLSFKFLPYRVCVGMPLPDGVRVKMEVLVCSRSEERSHMHVQSMSQWAPANIGPYSQSYTVSFFWVPPTMTS